MGEFLKKILRKFLYCGVKRSEYKSVKKDSYIANFHTWKIIHVFLTIAFFILGIAAYINRGDVKVLTLNILMSVYSFIIVVLFSFAFKPDGLIAQLIIYLTMILLLLTGMHIALKEPYEYAVIFVVLLVLLPVFMIDKPYFMTIILVLASITFLIHDYYICKDEYIEVFNSNLTNICLFAFAGIVSSVFYNGIRVKEFLMKKGIEHERDTDALTGISNRTEIFRKLNHFIGKSDSYGIMIIMDIDKFKAINDNYGHDVGDLILKNYAQALKKYYGTDDLIGRFGGDEFIVFMYNSTDLRLVEERTKNFIEFVNQYLVIPQTSKTVNTSVGIALYLGAEKTYDELFKRADIALYKSKENGGNIYTIDK